MKPKLKLTGQDGNAFNLLGLAKRIAKKAGWTDQQFAVVLKQATSGDYNHLLAVLMDNFDVS